VGSPALHNAAWGREGGGEGKGSGQDFAASKYEIREAPFTMLLHVHTNLQHALEDSVPQHLGTRKKSVAGWRGEADDEAELIVPASPLLGSGDAHWTQLRDEHRKRLEVTAQRALSS
jgi:hypothetical protein